MSFLVTVVVPDAKTNHANERVLATRVEDTLRAARAWSDRNSDTFRLALDASDSHFESWIQGRSGEVVLHIRYTRAVDTIPEVSTRTQLKTMRNSNRKRGWQ